MKDWRIKYKTSFLATIINRRRWENRVYDYVKPNQLGPLIRKTMQEHNLTELSAINKLINEVKEGKLL